MDNNQRSSSSNSPAVSQTGKGKERSSISGTGPEASRPGSSSSGGLESMTGLMGSLAASARNMASALDPTTTTTQADLMRQHRSFGSSSAESPFAGGSTSKASTSSASRTFQHTTNALETIGSTSSGSATTGSAQPSGFRTSYSHQTSGADTTGGMDWDNFLASSESTLPDDQPYKPPSMSSFGFSTFENTFAQQQQQQQQHQQPLPPIEPHEQQQRQDLRMLDSVYQAHLAQPMNLTPANHAAFLEYLKSTAHDAQSLTMSSSTSHVPTTTLPYHEEQQQQQHYHAHQFQPQQYNYPNAVSTTGPFSNDIHRQQHMDGNEVLAFLDSTSYSDFVDQVEAEGIEKHQMERREFVYSESTLGPQNRSLFSTLQLIQHLPSERQDIVQYLLQQGTYTDDIWSRPFGHDAEREEAASLAATQVEQDQFLRQQHEQSSSGSGSGEGATTEEMETLLKQIVDDAKTEVKTGETNGKALNRLMMVRSHITMGTKL
ncbi:hypothetical protein EDD21DRAFT_393388 [Dissophora ornata]|nr:hypothetical protein EDD21DRAFT_393388 [Dissophora ornata]